MFKKFYLRTNNSHSQDDFDRIIERLIIQERLRQATISFNIAIALILVSTILYVSGVGLLISGKISIGVATTAGGLTSNIVTVQLLGLYKASNDRLDEVADEDV